FAKDLDVIGWDAYRGAAYSNSPSKEGASALGHDLYRCMKQKPFWVLETDADQNMTAAYTAEMIAHGAAGVMFFHYRQHRAGAEQTLRCLADLHGDPVPERVGFTKTIAARPELQEELPESFPPRAAAIVYDYDCVHEQQRRFSYPKPMPYLDALMRMYLPAWRGGLGLDVIDPADDLSAYSLILLPHHHVCTEAFAAKLTAYVAQGGNLFLTARTCHKDEHGTYHPHFYGPLLDLTGAIAHEETDLKSPTACIWDGQRHEGILQAETLTLTGDSEVLSTFEGGVLDGKPALLHRRHGKGRCWFAAASHESLNRQVLETICRELDLPFVDHPHARVAVLPHLSRNATWIFNHSNEPVELLGHPIPAGDFALIDLEA
ncbi:MAG: beta-galactosidase trimerization domain-containing protein, partial [Kiritimatiellia bacterium]